MVEKDIVRRGYDELAETYAARRETGGGGLDVLSQFLDPLSGPARVLDAGCGQGTPVLPLIGRDATAVGVDFSREQLRLAAGNAPDASLVQGDMTALPFGDGVFDAVVAYWSLIHVPLEDHQTVVDQFARLLRPGGRVLLCEGTGEWVGENPDWLDSGVEMQWEIAGPDATRDHLRNAGFDLLDSWGIPESLAYDETDGTGSEGNETDGPGFDGDDSDRADSDGDDANPWTFFAARLET